jgi:hypothetical protein
MNSETTGRRNAVNTSPSASTSLFKQENIMNTSNPNIQVLTNSVPTSIRMLERGDVLLATVTNDGRVSRFETAPTIVDINFLGIPAVHEVSIELHDYSTGNTFTIYPNDEDTYRISGEKSPEWVDSTYAVWGENWLKVVNSPLFRTAVKYFDLDGGANENHVISWTCTCQIAQDLGMEVHRVDAIVQQDAEKQAEWKAQYEAEQARYYGGGN